MTDNKLLAENKMLKKIVYIMFVMFIIVFVVMCYHLISFNHKEIKVVKVKEKLDNNYVFVGDSITWMYKLSDYYKDMPVVNSGIDGNTTDDVVENIKSRIYDYNPSKVFILIGTNDIIYGKSDEHIVSNVDKIIKGIKKNRPNCEIYIESIYPINNTDDEKIHHDMVKNRTNSRINTINSKIKKICNLNGAKYINIHDLLLDEDGNLKLEYTNEGLHISPDGYKVITNKIKEYIEK